MINSLLDFMAKACHYAQEHVGDPDAWGDWLPDREKYFQCISYQMACFLSQNTVNGKYGVDWSIVIEQLTDTKLNKGMMMVKSVKKWKKILQDIADDLGGWKNP